MAYNVDPRPFPPEFEQQDYPKIIYKEEQKKVDHNPDLSLVLNENYFIAQNAEEEANPPWKPKAAAPAKAATSGPGWDKKEA